MVNLCKSSPYCHEEIDWRLVNLSMCNASLALDLQLPRALACKPCDSATNINKQHCTHQKAKLDDTMMILTHIWGPGGPLRCCLPPVLRCKAQGNEDEGIVRFSATRAELLESQDVEGFQTTSYCVGEELCKKKCPCKCKAPWLVKILWMYDIVWCDWCQCCM